MPIILRGWTTRGFRCPDMSVSLDSADHLSSGPGVVSLLLMPNGTGKSTLIELISLALTGQGSSIQPSRVREFSSNDPSIESPLLATFELRLALGNRNQKIEEYRDFSFILEFDFDGEQIRTYTYKDAEVGRESGHKPPLDYATYFNPRCVEVFVFKGDRAENLLKHDRDDAEQAIKAFFRLDRIEDLQTEIDELFAATTSATTTDRTESRAANRIRQLNAKLRLLRDSLKSNQEQLLLDRDRLAEISKDIDEAMKAGNAATQQKQLEQEVEMHRKSYSQLAHGLMNELRNPLVLSPNIIKSMIRFKDNLDSLKLPGTSRQFFVEVSSSDRCICDAPITNEVRAKILANAESFLGDEHIAIVNGVKQVIDDYSVHSDVRAKEVDDLAASLVQTMTDLEQSRQKLSRLFRKTLDEQNSKVLEEHGRLSGSVKQRESAIEELNAKGALPKNAQTFPVEEIRSIYICQKLLKEAEQRHADGTRTTELRRKKELLKDILEDAVACSLAEIKEMLRQKSNEKLSKILPRGTNLEISVIDRNLRIATNNREQSQGSGGQNVAVAYSFAASVLESSGAQFPLIVDHPVTALMESASRVLGATLPNVCSQFVGFVIDRERPGFVPALRRSASACDSITVFRKIPENQKFIDALNHIDQDLYRESHNGVVCTDVKFFDDFKDPNPDQVDLEGGALDV